jgi:hypothetical protein
MQSVMKAVYKGTCVPATWTSRELQLLRMPRAGVVALDMVGLAFTQRACLISMHLHKPILSYDQYFKPLPCNCLTADPVCCPAARPVPC